MDKIEEVVGQEIIPQVVAIDVVTTERIEKRGDRDFKIVTEEIPVYTEIEKESLKNSLIGEITAKQEQKRILELEIEALTQKYHSI